MSKIYVLTKVYDCGSYYNIHSAYDNIEQAEAVKRALELDDERTDPGDYWQLDTLELNAYHPMNKEYSVWEITIKYDIDSGKIYSYDVKKCPEYTVWDTVDGKTEYDDEQGEYSVCLASKSRRDAVSTAMELYVEHLKQKTRRMATLIDNINQYIQRLNGEIEAQMYK